MDNYDKIFNRIKEASEKTETGDFPAMDKVWSRVEEKLDKEVLTKQNQRWKKIAIAASVLLVSTIAYQFLKSDPLVKNEDLIVIADSVKIERNDAVVADETFDSLKIKNVNPIIKADAEKILQKQIVSSAVVNSESTISEKTSALKENVSDQNDTMVSNRRALGYSSKSANRMKKQIFEARSVEKDEVVSREQKSTAEQVVSKSSPLVVIDGKPVKVANAEESKDGGMSKIDPENLEDIVVLKEPLYIINGHYYSELELFGPNPTSPYAPLNQQEIETLSILQGEKAIANYGKRGEKGVVIITTKNGKPVKAADTKGN